MKRSLVVPAIAMLALPFSLSAFAQDANQTPSAMSHGGMARSTAMSHNGATAHDSMGHNGMSRDTTGHDTMGHGAMTHATPDRMSAPDQPK